MRFTSNFLLCFRVDLISPPFAIPHLLWFLLGIPLPFLLFYIGLPAIFVAHPRCHFYYPHYPLANVLPHTHSLALKRSNEIIIIQFSLRSRISLNSSYSHSFIRTLTHSHHNHMQHTLLQHTTAYIWYYICTIVQLQHAPPSPTRKR